MARQTKKEPKHRHCECKTNDLITTKLAFRTHLDLRTEKINMKLAANRASPESLSSPTAAAKHRQ
jgi:hypothetical protein